MNEKKYLIYLDILGFEVLAGEISSKKGIEQRDIRKKFIGTINERIEKLEEIDKIVGKKYGKSDDWLLVTDALDKIFYCIFEILDHNTGYKNYEKIPLEIAIGTGEYDKWARLQGINLVVEESTIKFLKTKIVGYYHEWYKKHKDQSPKSTFIVLTEPVYHELELQDKKACQKIEINYKKDGKRNKVNNFFVIDVIKVQQRGKVFEFLERKGMGISCSKVYDRINELYVPPIEYNEIKYALKKDKIVFITGTAEYGKTYTAIRLLWEYFNKGYEPRWIKGGEEKERRDVRKRLEEIERELKPQHILYFEDPFGKIKYEKREGLEREIGTITESIKNVKNVYVIVTSRDEIFKEFKKEHLSSIELEEFEKKLNIKKPSYSFKKRKEILLKWASAKDCKWLKDISLKNIVLESLSDKKILPTPLSIRAFSIASVSITDKDELIKTIIKKSKETSKSFAKEIESMTRDKILFLSFPFISNFYPIGFVKSEYKKLVKELKIKEAWEFDKVLNWFRDEKIDVREGLLIFSHPSYYEAFEHLLKIKRVSDIFSKVLLKVIENEKFSDDLEFFVVENFDKFPEKIGNEVLFRLSEKEERASALAYAIADAENFDKLPEKSRNLLIKVLIKVYGEFWEDIGGLPAVRFVVLKYDKFPEKVMNFLFELAEVDIAVEAVADAVEYNFDKLAEKERTELLLKLSKKDRAAESVVKTLVKNFDRLPKKIRNLLFKFSEKDRSAIYVAWAITKNFDKLPENVRNELLLKLSEKEEAAWGVAEAITKNFDKLPEDVRNLIFKLSEKDNVSWAIVDNFERLPGDVRNLLFKLSEKDRSAGDLAYKLFENFYKFPEKMRNELLLKLSEKEEAAEYVAKTVANNYDKLPTNVRYLLFKLSEKDEATRGVEWATADNFEKLPVNVRNELLLRLSEKDNPGWGLEKAIAKNFDKIPEKIRNKLLLMLSEKESAAFIVMGIIAENFNEIPEKIRNELLFKFSEKDNVAEDVTWIIAENFDELPEKVRNLLIKLQNYLKELLVNLSEPEDYFEHSQNYYDKIEAINIISKVKSKLDKNFALTILNKLVDDVDGEYKIEAQELISCIREELKDG